MPTAKDWAKDTDVKTDCFYDETLGWYIRHGVSTADSRCKNCVASRTGCGAETRVDAQGLAKCRRCTKHKLTCYHDEWSKQEEVRRKVTRPGAARRNQHDRVDWCDETFTVSKPRAVSLIGRSREDPGCVSTRGVPREAIIKLGSADRETRRQFGRALDSVRSQRRRENAKRDNLSDTTCQARTPSSRCGSCSSRAWSAAPGGYRTPDTPSPDSPPSRQSNDEAVHWPSSEGFSWTGYSSQQPHGPTEPDHTQTPQTTALSVASPNSGDSPQCDNSTFSTASPTEDQRRSSPGARSQSSVPPDLQSCPAPFFEPGIAACWCDPTIRPWTIMMLSRVRGAPPAARNGSHAASFDPLLPTQQESESSALSRDAAVKEEL